MKGKRIWRVKQDHPALIKIFQHELGVSAVLARLLINRGIYTVDDARYFLEADTGRMFDPYLMADMDKAVRRISLAIGAGEKILVYGDYDADGTTSTALLVKALRRLGGQADYFIPHRLDDGYGLHLDAVHNARKQGYSLLITVDCGISGFAEVEAAVSAGGPDIVITDHHEVPERIPPAAAVVNPKRPDCPYPFKELAGVGVAMKLAQALLAKAGFGEDAWLEYLDLACLGTISDVVPLQGENRILVKHGLPRLANALSPGLQALIAVAGLKPERLGTREVAFALSPRLNAAGRVGDPAAAVELLLCDEPEAAMEMAAALNRGNQERQQIESLVLAEAQGMLDASPELASQRVIVLGSRGWHPGVIGIVASRLVDKYYRPVLMVAIDGGEGPGKGSGRSIPGFHLYDALSNCRDCLLGFGGHAQAAGFSVSPDRLEDLRRAINDYAARQIPDEIYTPELELDATVSLGEISRQMVEELEMMAPFGHCNPGPLLACREARLVSCREVGRNAKHLKLMVGEKDVVLDGIAFNMASRASDLSAAATVDMAFVPSMNYWNGRKSVQLEVLDIKPSKSGFVNTAESKDNPWDVKDSLEKLGHAAYLPEYISGCLGFINSMADTGALPEGDLAGTIVSPGASEKSGREVLPVIKNKWRIPHRPAFIKMMAFQPGRTLVVACSPSRTVEVACYLLFSGISAAFLHQGLGRESREHLKARFVSQDITVLVATPGMLSGLKEAEPSRVVLCDPPFCREELQNIKGYAGGAGIYAAYSSPGLAEYREMIEANFPPREGLGIFYNYLRRECPGGVLDPVKAAAQLRSGGMTRAGVNTLAVCLKIFAELGLIQYTYRNGIYQFKLLPVSKKKDLKNSPVYARGRAIRDAAERWWGKLEGLTACR